MPQASNFLLLDDAPESSEGFIAYAEIRGFKSYAARNAAQFARLAARLDPVIVAINLDIVDLDPIAALEELARLGQKPECILFGRERRLLELASEAARLLRLGTPQAFLGQIDFRALNRTSRARAA